MKVRFRPLKSKSTYLGLMVKSLEMLYIYNDIFTKYLVFYYYYREYIVNGQNLMEFLVHISDFIFKFCSPNLSSIFPPQF